MSPQPTEPRIPPDPAVVEALRDLDRTVAAGGALDAAGVAPPRLALVPGSSRGGAEHPFRPLIADVHVATAQHEVLVTLDLEGWVTTGAAPLPPGDPLPSDGPLPSADAGSPEGAGSSQDDGSSGAAVTEAAARATLGALRDLVPDGVRLALVGVEEVPRRGEVPRSVLAAVRLTAQDGHDELLLGAVVVRAAAAVAAVRATLDALNRRLGQLVRDG